MKILDMKKKRHGVVGEIYKTRVKHVNVKHI